MKMKLSLFIALALTCAGCTGFRPEPKLPQALNPEKSLGHLFDDPQWYSKFHARIAGLDNQQKRALRDEYIAALKALVDRNYQVYRNRLSGAQSELSFAGDAASVLLAGAGTVTNGSRAKTVISAVASAASGIQGKAAADFYGDLKQGVVIQHMDAMRESRAAFIASLQAKKNYSDYPIEAAFGDLLDYFYSGTAGAAISDIQTQTGVARQQANQARRQVLNVP